MPKEPLPVRLDTDLIARLKRASLSRKIPVNDVISLALDGLEGERVVAQNITDLIANLEDNLAALVDLMELSLKNMGQHFSEVGQCFNEAGALEKERMGALYRLLESRIKDHDAAELERFRSLMISSGTGI